MSAASPPTRRVGILVFDDAEVLDVAGPYEVFSVTGRRQGIEPFEVLLVAATPDDVVGRHRFVFTPHATFETAPRLDLLCVPGGIGTRRIVHDERAVRWVATRAHEAELVLSVCTGSLVLARAGLLQGLAATTHHSALEELEQLAPETEIRPTSRVVDNGRVVCSAGVAAGIEMSLHVVERLLGHEVALETAAYIEYPWYPGQGVWRRGEAG